MEYLQFFTSPLIDLPGTSQLIFRFLFNAVFVWIIIHIFYYRKTKKLDYYFTFMLISISVFLLIYMLGTGQVKLKVGMALGLFAIFGIIRYRTEVISVREMTYLFVIITLSVINALSANISFSSLCLANLIFVFSVWIFEGLLKFRQISCKYILYDRVDNVKPEHYEALVAEISERTGLKILNIEVGAINYLQDSVMLKVYYENPDNDIKSVDKMLKLPKNE